MGLCRSSKVKCQTRSHAIRERGPCRGLGRPRGTCRWRPLSREFERGW